MIKSIKKTCWGWVPIVWLLMNFKNVAKTYNLNRMRLSRNLYDYPYKNLIYEQWTGCIAYLPWGQWQVSSTPWRNNYFNYFPSWKFWHVTAISTFWLDAFGERREWERGLDALQSRLTQGPWKLLFSIESAPFEA